MTQDGVEDPEQLVHTGDERCFLGLVGGAQALVEGADDGVMALSAFEFGDHIRAVLRGEMRGREAPLEPTVAECIQETGGLRYGDR
jgi:hypothetical protein